MRSAQRTPSSACGAPPAPAAQVTPMCRDCLHACLPVLLENPWPVRGCDTAGPASVKTASDLPGRWILSQRAEDGRFCIISQLLGMRVRGPSRLMYARRRGAAAPARVDRSCQEGAGRVPGAPVQAPTGGRACATRCPGGRRAAAAGVVAWAGPAARVCGAVHRGRATAGAARALPLPCSMHCLTALQQAAPQGEAAAPMHDAPSKTS